MKYLLILILLCTTISVKAQTDFDSFANRVNSAFNAFKEAKNREYEDFRKKVNEEYSNFMRNVWKEYDRMNPIHKEHEEPPVPPTIMPEEDIDNPEEDNEVVINDVITPDMAPLPQPNPISPIKEIPAPAEDVFEFIFMGTKEHIRIGHDHRIIIKKCEEQFIADAWDEMCHERYNNVIYDCLLIRSNQNLCDWAYLQMLQTFGDSFYGKGTNESVLLSAFIYCQTGYTMRLAIVDGKLEMLFASRYGIYELPYYEIDGIAFYTQNLTPPKDSRVFPVPFNGEQDLSLIVGKEQRFSIKESERRSLKSDRYKDMNVTVSTNKNLLTFYDTYPRSQFGDDLMTSWAMYANTPLCNVSKEKLYSSLKKTISQKSQIESVNRLLNWVQTAFKYEYDDKVWGGDRPFFADETLYYPYCDCEDRSILFSRLVRDLVGLDVVLVYYPGHLATAVAFTDSVKGDYLVLNGKRFVVCDPTYIGAPVGYTMPEMDNASAKVILLER